MRPVRTLQTGSNHCMNPDYPQLVSRIDNTVWRCLQGMAVNCCLKTGESMNPATPMSRFAMSENVAFEISKSE